MCDDGNTHARRDIDTAGRRLERLTTDALPEPLRQSQGVFHGSAHGESHELFSAVSADGVAFSERGLQTRRRFPQHVVARQVAVAIVDALEVIEVGHHQRYRQSLTAGPCDLPVTDFEECPASEQAGEGIVHRLFAELLARGDELLLELDDARSGSNTCFQLPRVERLGDVVVGSRIESLENIVVSIVRCEKDDVDVLPGRRFTNRAAHLESVELWHRPVQDREGRSIRPFDRTQGLGAVDDARHLVAPAFQGRVEPMTRHRFVFCDEDADVCRCSTRSHH